MISINKINYTKVQFLIETVLRASKTIPKCIQIYMEEKKIILFMIYTTKNPYFSKIRTTNSTKMIFQRAHSVICKTPARNNKENLLIK